MSPVTSEPAKSPVPSEITDSRKSSKSPTTLEPAKKLEFSDGGICPSDLKLIDSSAAFESEKVSTEFIKVSHLTTDIEYPAAHDSTTITEAVEYHVAAHDSSTSVQNNKDLVDSSRSSDHSMKVKLFDDNDVITKKLSLKSIESNFEKEILEKMKEAPKEVRIEIKSSAAKNFSSQMDVFTSLKSSDTKKSEMIESSEISTSRRSEGEGGML